MKKCLYFLSLSFSLNLVAQNNYAQFPIPVNQQLSASNYQLSTKDATPIAHPAKKEFPYDFELQTKDPQYDETVANTGDGLDESLATACVMLCNFKSNWQPTTDEIKSMINEESVWLDEYHLVFIRIKPASYKCNFLSY